MLIFFDDFSDRASVSRAFAPSGGLRWRKIVSDNAAHKHNSAARDNAAREEK